MIATLIAMGVLTFVYLTWWPGWETIKRCPRPFIIVPVLACIAIGIPVYGFRHFMSSVTMVPLSIECYHAPQSMIVPPEGKISILYLNAIPKENGGSGLGIITAQAGKDMEWPSLGNVYRCHLANHGNAAIFNVEMALTLKFMEALKDKTNPSQTNSGAITLIRDWIISIPKIEPGPIGTFDFYISNMSQQFVFVSLPSVFTFYRASSSTREESQLIQSPGLFMPFTP